MLKPPSLRVVVPTVALLVGSAGVGAAPAAAGNAGVPSSHVKECADDGLKDARSMTLMSSTSAKDSSAGLTSRARVWVYAAPSSVQRCVVTQIVGAEVPRKAGQSRDYALGSLANTDGRVVLDTGEVLPLVNAPSGLDGKRGRTYVTADVLDVTKTERIEAEDAANLPQSLAGLAGHEATIELSSWSIDVYSQAWSTKRVAKPLTRSQQKRALAAEIRRAKARHAERIEEMAATRDEQLAIAATETGLPAAWRIYAAKQVFWSAKMVAHQSLWMSKRLARQRAEKAGRVGVTREAYAHRITIEVPLG